MHMVTQAAYHHAPGLRAKGLLAPFKIIVCHESVKKMMLNSVTKLTIAKIIILCFFMLFFGVIIKNATFVRI